MKKQVPSLNKIDYHIDIHWSLESISEFQNEGVLQLEQEVAFSDNVLGVLVAVLFFLADLLHGEVFDIGLAIFDCDMLDQVNKREGSIPNQIRNVPILVVEFLAPVVVWCH